MSLTSACPGPGVGTATSSTARSFPNALTTAAFMVDIVLSWLLLIVTLLGGPPCTPGCGRAGSEEAELLGGVRHEQVLGLLVVGRWWGPPRSKFGLSTPTGPQGGTSRGSPSCRAGGGAAGSATGCSRWNSRASTGCTSRPGAWS